MLPPGLADLLGKKDLTEKGKQKWSNIANEVLVQTGSESQAKKVANAQTRAAVQRRLMRKHQTGRSS